VILMSAVIESGRVTPEVLLRYSADGYAAKPLDTTRLLRIVRELLGQRRAALGAAADEAALKRALDRYEAGDRGGAIAALRERVAARPGAARVRFALANLLQRERQRDDAVREYEAVIAAQPDYFPALTRLAYLYYERGQHGRAVETWRRALPYCPDRQLRRNIELFVRSLAKAPR
jgi:tetratricopeptide (TPR) repeat protein